LRERLKQDVYVIRHDDVTVKLAEFALFSVENGLNDGLCDFRSAKPCGAKRREVEVVLEGYEFPAGEGKLLVRSALSTACGREP